MSTGSSGVELQDIFRIDRVGIAQPVLDRRHRQFQRPRRARRLWRGLRDRLDLVGPVQFAGEARYFSPARFAAFQRSSPATASSRCRKREATAGAPPTFAAWREDDLVGAEQLREVVRGEADAPLRQIEAEFVPHRPAQPGIDPRRRRPDAFDQPAQNDAIGFASAALRAARRCADARRPIPAAAPCGRRTRSGTRRDNRRAGPSVRLVAHSRADRRTPRLAPMPWLFLEGNGDRRAGRATAPINDLAVALRQFGEIMRF